MEGQGEEPAPWTLTQHTLAPGDMLDENDVIDDAYYVIVRETLEHTLAHFADLLPETRPPLPRFPLNKVSIEIIGVLGTYLEPYLDFNDPSRTMAVLYCGAIAACRLAGVQLPYEIIERICNKPHCALLQAFRANQH